LGSRTALVVLVSAIVGCAETRPPATATDPRADRVRASLEALAAAKGYRAVRRVARAGRETVLHDLVLAPDYVHSTTEGNPAAETFARGTRVAKRSSSGRGWLVEEVPSAAGGAPGRGASGARADVDALLRWAGPDASFAAPRAEDGCDVVEFSLDGDALARVARAQGGSVDGARRLTVSVWIGADGLPRRARQVYEGTSPREVVVEFSDVGIDSDPDLPGAVRRLLELP